MSETPSYKQINQQETTAYIDGSKTNPTVLVKRTDGRVTVGNLHKDSREVRFSENGDKLKKTVPMESLTDAHQELLAAELAGRALRGSEVSISINAAEQEQVAAIDPLDELPSDVRDEVLGYRRVVRNKQESERDKNFAQAAEDGRLIYRVQQSLSPAAKQFLGLR